MKTAFRILAGIICVLQSAVTAAQPVVTAQDFARLVTGRTIHFALDGEYFGSEQFFEDGRTLWRYADGLCEHGTWKIVGGNVCFRYEDNPAEMCWATGTEQGRMYATRVDEAGDQGITLRESHSDTDALPCPGPRVGS